jgi:hypothetical protein
VEKKGDSFGRITIIITVTIILNRRIQFIVLISIIFTGYIVQTFAIYVLATFVKLSVSGHLETLQ